MPRRPVVRDALLAGVLLALLAVDSATATHVEGSRWITFLLLAPQALGLLLRRTNPTAMVLLLAASDITCSLVATQITDMTATLLPILVTGWNAGRYADRRALPWIIAIYAATVVVVDVIGGMTSPGDFAFPLAMIGIPMAVGRTLRNRGLVAAELAERT